MNDTRSENPDDRPEAMLDVTIEKLVTGGAGLGRLEGQIVFVPLTAPGDKVRFQPIKRRKGFIEGALSEILEPGPGRQDPSCPHFGQCGGCDLQHLTEETQRQVKADIVSDCFGRLGKVDLGELLVPPEPVGPGFGYRNRIRLYANPAGFYGMMRRGTNDVVPLDACPIMPEFFNSQIMPWLRFLPPVEQIVIRLDGKDGWLISIFGHPTRQKILKKIVGALTEDEPPAPGCTGLLFNNRPLWGRDYLLHEVAGHTFRVGAHSFFQGNLEVTEQAVATVRTWLAETLSPERPGPLLGDLFCGVGLFSLTLADLFERVIAVDSDAAACRDARNNVQHDAAARKKVQVHDGDLAEAGTDVLADPELATAEQWQEATCVVDPPRTGLGPGGVKELLRLGPAQIIYMSCDPATLARDVASLAEGGYKLMKLSVLDMFPQTAHIETLVLLLK